MELQKTWRLLIPLSILITVAMIVFKISFDKSTKLADTAHSISTDQIIENEQTAPKQVKKQTTQRKESDEQLSENMADEKKQLDEFVAWLEAFDQVQERRNSSNETNERAKEDAFTDDLYSKSEANELPTSSSDEEVLDFLTSWPVSGSYYVQDFLHHLPEDLMTDEFKGELEAILADNPNATIRYRNPLDPDSGVMGQLPNGTFIPFHQYLESLR